MDPLISIVMPYWERYEVTVESMQRYKEFYEPEKVEVILVDDGSTRQPADMLEGAYAGLKIVSLPKKEKARNPCVPINRGMEATTGKVVGLSNPEVIHENPVLYEMLDLLENENDYVLAPAYCPEMSKWHCHPELTKAPMLPKGAGFHFLSIMMRQLWEKTEGFDEEYRDGFGYDDTDFVQRLLKAGANFKFTKSKVIHKRTGAKTSWGMPSNRERFCQKWGK